ncbi:LacI family DNA-binding transcriptional regulator [Quadrisphaera sp. INWT6]|uniref:LacI family DNA-binding transcriptional regulator n=1 Tax=Quadrisphaera sp. INWT6 TaxID=2596917 RepID=UPI0018921E9A|nr:LacI family DNA-binding transcriptional regulator [Quadrisphaera sp. INWT6]MBF5081068.1 LacI family transcriptional regulator [Quadrisphaera sp. INWT6]
MDAAGSTPGRATLVSVAEAAGVSRQTVSNALHAPDKVAPDTLERVLATIEELGYRPSLAARQLRTRRSRTLGLRLEHWGGGISGSVLDRFLHALVDEAQARDHRVVLFTADDDAGEVAGYDELLTTTQVDGFVLTSTHAGDQRTSWLSRRGVPFATFGRPWPEEGAAEGAGDQPAHCWVDVDGAAGTRAATEHLLASGHRAPAFLGWPAGSGTGEDRRRGWAEALDAAGVPARERRELAVPESTAAAASAVSAALEAPGAPSSVVCASDTLALGARGAATRHRAALDVVGFDDTPVAAAIGMSSVAQPLAEAAHLVVDLLVAQVETGAGPPQTCQHLLAPRLVVRSSPT